MNLQEAKHNLDKIITKGRVHLYKPIQIAEILYRDRTHSDIDLNNLDSYRNISKRWRDTVTESLVGRSSTSSARYQDDVFNANAVPPEALVVLGEENRRTHGAVEAYIYRCFADRFSQMSIALTYCETHTKDDFYITDFINLFWKEAGLRRSIDKIFEIIVFSLFSTLVEAMGTTISIQIDPNKTNLLHDFSDFSSMVLGLESDQMNLCMPAKIFRVGVTNAADRGLDMYANFGMAIQIKHLSLTEELANTIVSTVQADRVIIVCKESERGVILSLLTQIGWKARIQSIITEKNLETWYDKALRGTHNHLLGDVILRTLNQQIRTEFPATANNHFTSFFEGRNYHKLDHSGW